MRQVRNAIAQRGLILVGWYHSHPSYQPDPSVQDIHNQLKYQSILQQENAPYGPCLGIIVCKYFRDFIPRINDTGQVDSKTKKLFFFCSFYWTCFQIYPNPGHSAHSEMLTFLFISAPYDTYRPTKESVIRAFWVQASPDSQPHKLGVPMLINTTLHQDQFLTQDLLNELVSMINKGFFLNV